MILYNKNKRIPQDDNDNATEDKNKWDEPNQSTIIHATLKHAHTQTTNRQSMGNTQTINVKTNTTGACAEREEKKGRKEGNARDASRVVSRGFSKGTET